MIIHIATDHAGWELKLKLVEHLIQRGHQVIDHGANDYDADDDYPVFVLAAAEAVASDWRDGKLTLGVVLGGSGNGEQIAANKVSGIRAALVWNQSTAELARRHNNANVMALGARQHDLDSALALVDRFIDEPFSDEARHVRRIQQLADYEQR